jgi:hypothetical protein
MPFAKQEFPRRRIDGRLSIVGATPARLRAREGASTRFVKRDVEKLALPRRYP